MNKRVWCSVAMVLGLAVLFAAWPTTRPLAQQPPRARRADRRRRHRRRGHQQERARGRRVGDRGDHRARHPVRQDGGHRRSRSLRDSRPAARPITGVGARLRAGGFPQGQDRARPDRESHRGARAEREGRGGILSGASTGSPCSRFRTRACFPGTGADGNGMPVAYTTQEQWLQRRAAERLRQLPPARRQGHARDSRGPGDVQQFGRRLAAAAPVRARRRPAWPSSSRA